MEHRCGLLSHLATQWHVAGNPRRATRTGAGEGGTGTDALGRDYRQPVSQDDGKRGPRGYDGGKQIKGRKRHIVVDTLGLILAIVVHAANVPDRDGAYAVLAKLAGRFPRLELIWADGGYRGQVAELVKLTWGWTVEVVTRATDAVGFVVLPRRWVVERTFGWFGRYRILSKDYEQVPASSEAAVLIAMIQVMLKRLEPP